MASAVTNRLSRDDFRKAKELEELRKTGAAPPELDDEGRIINPHIPQYISSAPWYYNSTRPGLKHQYLSKYKPPAAAPSINAPNKVLRTEQTRHQYTAGACDNCGSATHTAKDCLERPRKRNAKHGGEVIGKDEWVQQDALDYDGKRDRWKGYDSREYSAVIERYEKAELERKKKKLEELEAAYRQDKKREEENETKDKYAETKEVEQEEKKGEEAAKIDGTTKLNATSAVGKEGKGDDNADVKESDLEKLRRLKKEKRLRKLRKKIALATAARGGASASSAAGAASPSSSDTDSDTDTDAGSDDDVKDGGEVITKMDTKARITVRNLRIREDTAKYLRNLHPNSAYYDPKTRSMRQNPYEGKSADEVLYAGDNFVRSTGDVKEIAQLHKYVWDNTERQQLEAEAGGEGDGGVDIHAVALPSAAEKLYRAHKEQQQQQAAQSKNAILHRYGGEHHLIHPPLPSMLQHIDTYTEYDDSGRVITGGERETARSKYEEDVREDGHSAVWGSWWDRERQRWGYACCHGTVRHAMCIGEIGRGMKREMEFERVKREVQGAESEQRKEEVETGKKMESRGEKRRRDEADDIVLQLSSSSHHVSESELDAYRSQMRHNVPIASITDVT